MRCQLSSRIMPRTTIDLDPIVLAELHRRSRRERKSMGRLASEILAAGLAERGEPAAEPFEWIASDLGKPSVDLEDEEAVRRILAHDHAIRSLKRPPTRAHRSYSGEQECSWGMCDDDTLW